MKNKILILMALLLMVSSVSAREYDYHYFYFGEHNEFSSYFYGSEPIIQDDSLFVKNGGYIQPDYFQGSYQKIYVFNTGQVELFARNYGEFVFQLLNQPKQ